MSKVFITIERKDWEEMLEHWEECEEEDEDHPYRRARCATPFTVEYCTSGCKDAATHYAHMQYINQ